MLALALLFSSSFFLEQKRKEKKKQEKNRVVALDRQTPYFTYLLHTQKEEDAFTYVRMYRGKKKMTGEKKD